MCYDSGTVPFSLCDDPTLFFDLVFYREPKHSLLGDEEHSISVLEQGLLDIVIDNTYRIQLAAQLTSKTPTGLMSTLDHIRYTGCDVKSENGEIRVIFSNFSFLTKAANKFGFPVVCHTYRYHIFSQPLKLYL